MSDFVFYGAWENAPPFYCFFWYHPRVNESLKQLFGTQRTVACFFINRKQYLFSQTQWREQFEKEVNEAKPDKVLEQFAVFDDLFDAARKGLMGFYEKTYEQASNDELNGAFQQIIRLIQSVTPFDQYCMLSEEFHLKKLKNALQACQFPEEKFNELLTLFCSPVRQTTTLLEEASIIRIAQAPKEQQASLIKTHLHEFSWLPAFLFAKPWDETYVKEAVREVSQKNLDAELTRVSSFAQRQKQATAEAMQGVTIDAGLVSVMQEIAFIRNEAETMVCLGSFVLQPVYQEIFRRTGLTEEQMAYLTFEEVEAALLHGQVFSDVIAERTEGMVYITNDHIELLAGQKAVNFFEKYYKEESQKEHQELKGMCACVGDVEGNVSKIIGPYAIKNFVPGNILVTESTCIDFLPIMRQAKAIVTEQGGITSHAAVVSRELGVPCIVSVPQVTKKLKDGDRIKVFASKGIVELL